MCTDPQQTTKRSSMQSDRDEDTDLAIYLFLVLGIASESLKVVGSVPC